MKLKDLKDKVSCDMISKKRNGNILFRQGFFYTGGVTAGQFKVRISDRLDALGVTYEVVEAYQTWKPFKGGASIANQSHWGCEVRIIE